MTYTSEIFHTWFSFPIFDDPFSPQNNELEHIGFNSTERTVCTHTPVQEIRTRKLRVQQCLLSTFKYWQSTHGTFVDIEPYHSAANPICFHLPCLEGWGCSPPLTPIEVLLPNSKRTTLLHSVQTHEQSHPFLLPLELTVQSITRFSNIIAALGRQNKTYLPKALQFQPQMYPESNHGCGEDPQSQACSTWQRCPQAGWQAGATGTQPALHICNVWHAGHSGPAFLIASFHTIANNKLPDGKRRVCCVTFRCRSRMNQGESYHWQASTPTTRCQNACTARAPYDGKSYSSIQTGGFLWACEEEEQNLNTVRQAR